MNVKPVALFVSALSAAFVFVSTHASAAPSGVWPTYAHDFSRSARADGVGKLKNPTVAWTKHLGGAIGGAIVADIDGDGRSNIVTISGGRVVATKPDGSTLWQGSLSGPRALLGAWALHASSVDIVVDTAGGVQVLSGTDGTLLTTLSMGAPSNAAFVPEGATLRPVASSFWPRRADRCRASTSGAVRT